MWRNTAAQLIFCAGFSFLTVSLFAQPAAGDVPSAIAGVFSLQDRDLNTAGTILLRGDWEFYWQRFLEPEDFREDDYASERRYVNVPGLWSAGTELPGKGYGTYRLRVRLDRMYTTLAVNISQVSAYRLWINGILYGTQGTIVADEAAYDQSYTNLVYVFEPRSRELDIVIQVSCFEHSLGGLLEHILIGTESTIQRRYTLTTCIELFVVGALVLMALYHGILFLFRRKDSANIVFCILCLTVAVFVLTRGQLHIFTLFPDLMWEVQIKTSHIVVQVFVLLLIRFFYILFPVEFPKTLCHILTGLFLSTSILIALIPGGLSVNLLFIHAAIIPGAAALILLVIIIIAVVRKREGAVYFLAGGLILFLCALPDFVQSILNLNELTLTPVGMLFLILSQSIMLARRSTRSFTRVENLAAELEETNKVYRRFVPYEFLQLLLKSNILEIRLGDQVEVSMTVLFSDIRSFTPLSESMSPRETFNFINSFLSRMGPIIRKHGGFIDKYIGDAIMALFTGASDNAVNAALEMQQELIRYNEKERLPAGRIPIRIGVGIHSGALMLGIIGEHERMESTVIADAVNLASRLEGLTKIYGCGIIISEAVTNKLSEKPACRLRELDLVKVKGKEQAVRILEILHESIDDQAAQKATTSDDFARGLDAYRRARFDEAIAIFQGVLIANPADTAAKLFLERCESHQKTGVPEDWDGIEALTEK
jgi:class 3 adenylate cyclase